MRTRDKKKKREESKSVRKQPIKQLRKKEDNRIDGLPHGKTPSISPEVGQNRSGNDL